MFPEMKGIVRRVLDFAIWAREGHFRRRKTGPLAVRTKAADNAFCACCPLFFTKNQDL